MKKRFLNRRLIIPVSVLLFLLLNLFAARFHTRADLTANKRFTLSKPTERFIRSISQPVQISVFLKSSDPAGFRRLAASAEDILREFKEIKGNRINFTFEDPAANFAGTTSAYADTLAFYGLAPINLTSQLGEGQQQQLVYPFALVQSGDVTVPVALYSGKTQLLSFNEITASEALLEYRLADAISKTQNTAKPLVAYITGNGEPEDYRVYDLAENVLPQDYSFSRLNINTAFGIPDTFKAAVIVKPTLPFSDAAKLKLDQYLLRGGKLLFFIDRLDAEMDSLQLQNQVTAFDRNLGLSDLLFNYGARINADLLMDLQCDFLPFDVNGNGQFDLLPWNYFPVLESKENHPVNKGLGFISGKFMNTVDTVEADGIEKTILLSSSANARRIGAPAIISGKENVRSPEDAKFKTPDIPVAVALEGKFRSLFANRLTTAMRDSLAARQENFIPRSNVNGRVIVAGDGDMVLNSMVRSNPIPMGSNPYTYGSQREFPFANAAFLQNSLEWLINENGLSEAKNKEFVPRLLDRKKVNAEKTQWQLINIAGPVIIVLLLALLYRYLLKRKFSRNV